MVEINSATPNLTLLESDILRRAVLIKVRRLSGSATTTAVDRNALIVWVLLKVKV
jgi:hypothetical protein